MFMNMKRKRKRNKTKEFKYIVIFLCGVVYVPSIQLLVYLFSLSNEWTLFTIPIGVILALGTVGFICYFVNFIEKLWKMN